VAEVLALVAALLFALAATLQQKGSIGMGEVSLGSPRSLLRLATQTFWLLGTLALLAGYVCQAIALDNGRLAVIQPLLVTTIVFALPLGYFLTNQIVNRREIVAAAFVVLGLAVFTVVGQADTGRDDAPGWQWAIAIALFGGLSLVLLLLGGHGSVAGKAALYGACAGVLYGLSASLWKPTAEAFDVGGMSGMLENWELYVFGAAGILAFVVQQVSLATGKLAASVAAVSVCNPLVSIAIGTVLLQERLADPLWHKIVAYAGLAVALLAAIAITRATEGSRESTDVSATPAPAT
jgi:drug/metabolite transporter (DMT)-like permease